MFEVPPPQNVMDNLSYGPFHIWGLGPVSPISTLVTFLIDWILHAHSGLTRVERMKVNGLELQTPLHKKVDK